MKTLSLVRAQGRGSPAQEYVEIVVHEACNLHDFMIEDQTRTAAGLLSNLDTHARRLPYMNVYRGDRVLVYTGKGSNSIAQMLGGRTCTVYLQLQHTIWNDGGDQATLHRIAESESIAVSPAPSFGLAGAYGTTNALAQMLRVPLAAQGIGLLNSKR